MNKKEIFRKIGGIITELNEQYDYLSKDPDHVNELELELFQANTHFLKDHIGILQKLNSAAPLQLSISPVTESPQENKQSVESKEDAKVEEPKAVIDEPEKEDVLTNTEEEAEVEEPKAVVEEPAREEEVDTENDEKEPVIYFLDEEPIPDEETEEEQDVEETDNEDEEIQVDEEEPVREEPVTEELNQPAAIEEDPKVNEVIINERTIVLDIPAEKPVPTVNDLISAQLKQGTVGGQFNSQPITDLKSSISLNDKLLFIKDLFNGYSLAYSEAIDLLNRFDNFESADNFLKANYSVKNNWATKQQTADKFYQALNRRFSK